MKELPVWDYSRKDDPQQVSIYAGPIVSHMLSLEKEACYSIDANYIDTHKGELTPKMRRVLVEWLIDSHYKYRMNAEVLHLSVNIVDRYLSSDSANDFHREDLQLLGVAALLIASKFEEIYPPSVHRLIYICEDAVSLNEVLEMEGNILKTLDFKLIGPSSNRFFNRFAEICDFDEKMKVLGRFLMDLMLMEYTALNYKASEIAASAAFVSMKIMKFGNEEKLVKERIGYDFKEIKSCSNLMFIMFAKMLRNENKYMTVRNKYSNGSGWNVFSILKF